VTAGPEVTGPEVTVAGETPVEAAARAGVVAAGTPTGVDVAAEVTAVGPVPVREGPAGSAAPAPGARMRRTPLAQPRNRSAVSVPPVDQEHRRGRHVAKPALRGRLSPRTKSRSCRVA
jgi:hypothetical protein